MTDKTESQRKRGLQKNVYEIFEGVSVSNQAETSKEQDTGPENPLVADSTLSLLKQHRGPDKSGDSRKSPRISGGGKLAASVAVLICISFAVYYLSTHEAPPLVLVAALFVLYVLGVSIGAFHSRRAAKTRQSG